MLDGRTLYMAAPELTGIGRGRMLLSIGFDQSAPGFSYSKNSQDVRCHGLTGIQRSPVAV